MTLGKKQQKPLTDTAEKYGQQIRADARVAHEPTRKGLVWLLETIANSRSS